MLHNCKGEYRSDFAPTNAQCSQDLDILDEVNNFLSAIIIFLIYLINYGSNSN